MIGLVSVVNLALLAFTPQDLLTTRALGQSGDQVRQALVDCSNSQTGMRLDCRVKISGFTADAHLQLSAVASSDGSRPVLGYELVFANFSTPEQATKLLAPLLAMLQKAFPRCEQTDSEHVVRYTFYDPRWAVTEVMYSYGWGVENSIVLTTKAVVIVPGFNADGTSP